MTNAIQRFPARSLLVSSADCLYPTGSSLVSEAIEAGAAPLPTAVPSVTANRPDSWWARSYKQDLPAVERPYRFLRGAWLPQSACAGWCPSAWWEACAPNNGEAC